MRKSESTGNERKSRRIDALPQTTLLLLIVLWQAAVSLGNVPAYIFPGPVAVIKALYEERSLLLMHTLATLGEAVIGFGLAILLGLAFGILMGYYSPLRRALYPLFIITQTIPLIVLAPLFAIWFGFGLMPKVLVIVLVCFFPVAVTFTQGLVKADENLDDLLKIMGASRWKAFKIARIPQALPALFSGLKIAATYSIMGAVISEWVGAQKGLGIYMTRAMTSFKTSVLFADVLIIVLLSLGFYKIVEIIEVKLIANIRYHS